MKYINVGIGEYAVAKSIDEELRTFALGSCIAVIIIDPVRLVAGMAHIALPDSSVDPAKAKSLPCYFANTGLPKLLSAVVAAGASSVPQHLMVKIVGGMNTLNNSIGLRNAEKIRSVLSSLSLVCQAEDVGGAIPRTVYYKPGDMTIKIHSPEGKKWEI